MIDSHAFESRAKRHSQQVSMPVIQSQGISAQKNILVKLQTCDDVENPLLVGQKFTSGASTPSLSIPSGQLSIQTPAVTTQSDATSEQYRLYLQAQSMKSSHRALLNKGDGTPDIA